MIFPAVNKKPPHRQIADKGGSGDITIVVERYKKYMERPSKKTVQKGVKEGVYLVLSSLWNTLFLLVIFFLALAGWERETTFNWEAVLSLAGPLWAGMIMMSTTRRIRKGAYQLKIKLGKIEWEQRKKSWYEKLTTSAPVHQH